MREYRITKYNPAIRASGRTYTEWTSFSDIGKDFDGTPLTQGAYEIVEAAYISVAIAFLREADVRSLSIRGLECRKTGGASYVEGEPLSLRDVQSVMAKILREELWCRLEGDKGFVHFGWDYYMYVGVPSICPRAEGLAAKVGLFVEEMPSPHHPEE